MKIKYILSHLRVFMFYHICNNMIQVVLIITFDFHLMSEEFKEIC